MLDSNSDFMKKLLEDLGRAEAPERYEIQFSKYPGGTQLEGEILRGLELALALKE